MEAQKFFEKFEGIGLTYNDILIQPGFINNFFPRQVSLSTKFTRNINLNIPVVSSPMDTVTESELAIQLALQGGIGVIHYNFDSYEEQVEHVKKVKRFENGSVEDPLTLSPDSLIEDVDDIQKNKGYSTIPITDDGTSKGMLVGMITKYDYSRKLHLKLRVKDRMIPLKDLRVAVRKDILSSSGVIDIEKANGILLDSHGIALPVVSKDGRLVSLVTRSDIEKIEAYPNAAVDSSRRLLVGAAVETEPKAAYERLEALSKVNVDAVIFDTSQGHAGFMADLINYSKEHYPDIDVVAGNVVTAEGAEFLIKAGADAVRVGMGSGSICTTQEVGAVGRSQASAVFNCASVGRKYDIPVIADGGVSQTSHIVLALGLGASTVMVGSMLACTDEAPGQYEHKEGIKLKAYRGMGSASAMEKRSGSRYSLSQADIKVPEGVEGLVTYKGPVSKWVPYLMAGLRQGMQKIGVKSIGEFHDNLSRGELQVERYSFASKQESGIHSLYSYKSAL